MKTKFITILVIQTILILVFLVYALVQQTVAVKAQREAVANAERAKRMNDELRLELEKCRKK